MIQFSQPQLERIRRKATPSTIKQIKQDNQVVLENEILVPEDNRATWNLYYFCPEHGVRLTWNRHNSEEHCCPVDGKVFTGEPYDGAWWRWLNGLNAKACRELGLLWQITGEQHYFDKVKAILLQYAKYYPDYEEHGGIPYNGPGKANAQTLCEANCNLDFALGYDFVCEALSGEERQYIEERLLREGAEFLMQHRTDQLHNHEMKINATIGVIGLLLNEEKYLDFALHSKYGIHYQLEHGMSAEGLWFEGSVHYHYYALQALLAFEKLARNTDYSVRSNPNYHTMLQFPLKLVLNTGDFPKLNDCIAGQEKLNHVHLFEFAYAEFQTPIFGAALNTIYQSMSRDNIDALLYGVDELPKLPTITGDAIHAPDSGITICVNQERNHSMLYKHAPYGGEHDHYDRLGLILIKDGKEILPDLGTTGYGAELHYGYYKNTSSHNTLVVNQSNQTPTVPQLKHYIERYEFTFVDALVDWGLPAATVDSHTLVHWDEESYKDIEFRRSILWLGDAAIEINQVSNPHEQQLDLTLHTRGEMIDSSVELETVDNPLEGPLVRMKDCKAITELPSLIKFDYDVALDTAYSQTIFSEGADSILTGKAPDNPATSDLSYVLLRSKQAKLKSMVLHDLEGDRSIASVEWMGNRLTIAMDQKGIRQVMTVRFDTGEVTFE
ncbi:heparinase II/III domain-containing protein [Vibrio celticus]|uniref:Heparinase II/III-like protein n=1 Tax=Vibrio celticus TaxID=446372 RepID=A0A1C3JLC1_9VIBR|nr:heparinase II/III family protein [Vibrio celticus]SBT15887.1 Heparinase II/III-like protein [Vibrio celticus]